MTVEEGPRSFWWTLTAILIAVLVVEIDASIVNVALPAMTGQFHAEAHEVARVILVYGLAIVAFLLVLGNLGDRVGLERTFTAVYAIFLAASVACGLSTGLPWLLTARFVQGVGGAMLTSTANALIIVHLPSRRHGLAFGLFGVFAGVGAALGPPAGGVLIHHFGWPWVFFVNVVPCGVALLLAARFLKPREVSEPETGAFDVLGGLLSTVAITSLVVLLNQGSPAGVLAGSGTWLTAVFAATSLGFVAREWRAPNPLVDLGLFRNPVFTCGLLSKSCLMMLTPGMLFVFPFFFTGVEGLPADRVGWLLGVIPLLSLAASPLAGWLCDVWGTWTVTLLGAAVTLAGAAFFPALPAHPGWVGTVVVFAVFGVGQAFFMTANSTLVMTQAPPGKEGMASSLNVLSIFLAALLGVNLFEKALSLGLAQHGCLRVAAATAQAIAAGYAHAAWLAVGLAVAAVVLSLPRPARGSSERVTGDPAPCAATSSRP